MEPLDPELSSLVAAERGEVEPAAADRERVARSLGTRVGAGFAAGLALGSTTTTAAAGAGASMLVKLGAVAALAGMVAVVAVPRFMQPAQVEPTPKASVAPVVSASVVATPPSIASAVTPAPPPATEAVAPAPRAPSAAAASLPPLAEEARLLKQAQQALRDGQAGAALAALVEHQRRFPRGQLSLERSAARIQALCGLGRKQQAEREAKQFLQLHPSSGLAAQVRASCGFAAP